MDNLEKWFYRVKEKVSAYDENDNFINCYEHIKDFSAEDLPIARIQAISYFNMGGSALPERLHYSFISPDEKNPGNSYAFYSGTISFVCKDNEGDFEENVIAGEDEEENSIGQDVEAIVWKENGYNEPVKIASVPLD